MRRARHVLSAAAVLALLLGFAPALPPAVAQTAPQTAPQTAAPDPATEPGTREIIDALSPRLRSLRNLGVRPRDAAASAPGADTPAAVEGEAGLAAAVTPGPASAPVSLAVAPSAAPAVAERASIALQVRFDFDSARIRADSSTVLGRLAEALSSAELAADRFLIEGHTDARGNAGYNQRLSQARADEVRRFLVERGVRAERVSAVGRGAQDPANHQDPWAAENRRVRIVNLAP